MGKVIIWGNGKIAEVAYYYLTHDSSFEIAGFCVDTEYKKSDKLFGLPVFEFEQLEYYYTPEECQLLFLIGYNGMNNLRQNRYYLAKKRGYSFISYIHSSVNCYTDDIGENVFIFENNVIQPFTKIGNNVVIWSGNHIGHHAVIEDNCFISSHVVISGSVHIGKNSFLGVNSTIRDSVCVGEYNLIGAGVTILKDTKDFDVYKSSEPIYISKKSVDLSGI